MAECLEMAEEVVKKQMKMVEKIYGAPWRLRYTCAIPVRFSV
jgi:hypothetical protein